MERKCVFIYGQLKNKLCAKRSETVRGPEDRGTGRCCYDLVKGERERERERKAGLRNILGQDWRAGGPTKCSMTRSRKPTGSVGVTVKVAVKVVKVHEPTAVITVASLRFHCLSTNLPRARGPGP
ncbi:hypothetical protein J6590_010860 [Homalodisca vitripennis]|nr:hypothetical protein J6590_010860 [Homalodisca vitripennis]